MKKWSVPRYGYASKNRNRRQRNHQQEQRAKPKVREAVLVCVLNRLTKMQLMKIRNKKQRRKYIRLMMLMIKNFNFLGINPKTRKSFLLKRQSFFAQVFIISIGKTMNMYWEGIVNQLRESRMKRLLKKFSNLFSFL